MTNNEKALQLVQKCLDDWPYAATRVIDIMKRLEQVKALLKEQEAKTGTWKWKIHGRAESGGTLGEAICDRCGKSTYATAVKGDLNYCPNCWAKMTDRR